MRTLSATLSTYLEGNAYLCADLFEFDVGGTTYRLTNAAANLTGVSPAAASTYTAANIDRERIRSADGLQVDDLEISIAHVGTEGLGGTTWVRLALDGELDEAPVRVYRAYLSKTTFAVVGCYLRFAGVVAQIEPGSTSLRLVVAVSANEFGAAFPAVTYESACVWNFAGPGCDYAGTVEYSVTVGSESTATILQVDAMPVGSPDDYKFLAGVVTVGQEVRTIIDAADAGNGTGVGDEITTGRGFLVSPAFSAAPQVGASATVRMGCIKTAAVCNDWHSNLVHFMGAPLAPAKQ